MNSKALDLKAVLTAAFREVGIDWYIKGVLDSKKRLYTISDDTKLISKVFELVSIPVITKALEICSRSCELEERQNVYPDLNVLLDGPIPNKVAIDIKSTYRKGANAGFTLGSYTAYMRPPFTKNISYPYTEYKEHWIVGFIYDRVPGIKPAVIDLEYIDTVVAPIKSIEVVIWQKWQIASDRPGSGNTANIGSVRTLSALRKGEGTFTQFGAKGREVFEDYWRNFDWKPPRKYSNLEGYLTWKKETHR